MIRIVVLQRGWVVVGRVERDGPLGQERVIRGGAIVRRWGTTRGLGELSAKGPLPATILDPVSGDMRCHELTVVVEIECEQAVWETALAALARLP